MQFEVLTDGLREVGASVSAIPAQVVDAAEPALTPDMKNALVRAGLTDLNGRILT